MERTFVRASQTENVPGDKVGLLNRIFGFAYYLRYPGKALKRRNKYTVLRRQMAGVSPRSCIWVFVGRWRAFRT